MGYLTTHVLDTANGCPATGLRVELFRIEGGARTPIVDAVTNDDGRCDGPLAEGEAFEAGVYELQFHAGAYFRARQSDLSEPLFVDIVPIRFGISAPDEHYHVPLLVSPFSYSTYRGS